MLAQFRQRLLGLAAQRTDRHSRRYGKQNVARKHQFAEREVGRVLRVKSATLVRGGLGHMHVAIEQCFDSVLEKLVVRVRADEAQRDTPLPREFAHRTQPVGYRHADDGAQRCLTT
jgi:hypothetical protein